MLGLGELPTVRLQRALARTVARRPPTGALDRVLVWAHWSWFIVPHGSLRVHPRAPPRAASRARAVLTYAVFDIGAGVYWLLPTAPPWYAAEVAAERGEPGERAPAVRRMMVEYGELFWRDGWASLYSVFGGNPLAAMPSLHFATSLMAALLLAEVGPVAGTLGFGYTATLGFALVYLGEHYVVDLLGGAALTLAVRRLGPRAGPAVARVGRAVAALEEMAHEGGLREGVSADTMAGGRPTRRNGGGRAGGARVRAGSDRARGGDAARARSRAGRSSPSPCSSSWRRLPVLRAAQPRRGRHDGAPDRGRRQLVDRRRRACCELLSFAGYVVLVPLGVSCAGRNAIGWRESYEITMAGLVATRLFAAAGAGGVALTAWALRRSGMEPRLVACRMVAFMVLLYVIYAGSLLIDGIGLGIGPVPRGRLVCDHDRPGDRGRRPVRGCRRDGAAAG